MMREVLEKRLAKLKAENDELVERSNKSTDVAEVRSIANKLTDNRQDIAELESVLAELDAQEERSGAVPKGAELRGGNPMASYTQTVQHEERTAQPYSSMEYRKAFMNYVQRGTPIPADVIQRAGGDEGTTVAGDIGAIIPSTIMDEFIKDVSKVYGQIYAKVRKINIKGGIKFPISKLKANFTWINEASVSPRQKAGDINDFVEFSYNIGEIRVSETLLAQVVSLPLFESEITRIMVEAYVETMDKVIISGTGKGMPLGITVDPRVIHQEGHNISMSVNQFSDWKAWRKELFSKIPLSKRGQGEFLFTAATVESNLLTMTDGNNRPVFKEATDLSIGESSTIGRFYGRNVTLVEPDVLADFDTANVDDIVGIYWVPTDYVVNTNLQFGMKRYFDEEKNEYVNKALTIVDGKMLDVSGCYIIRKK